MLQYFGLGQYCPAPRVWSTSSRRCVDPSNPDTARLLEPQQQEDYGYSTSTRDISVIRPEGRTTIRSDLSIAEDVAARAEDKLEDLGIDGNCGVDRQCPIGLQCFYSPYCTYTEGSSKQDAAAILSSHDVTIAELARKKGALVTGFPATTSGGPSGTFLIPEAQVEAAHIPSPTISTLPNHPQETILPDTREVGGGGGIEQFFSQNFEIGGMSVPVWGLGVAAFGALLLFKR